MTELVCYKTMPEWDAKTLPKAFRNQHNTKVGTWAKLTIFSGELKYYALDETGNVLETVVFDNASDIPFIEPQAWHKVEPLSEDLHCQLAFYCQVDDYYQKKYKLSATHSEVVEAMQAIPAGRALDIGCGAGRNALFLQRQGFEVTAFDPNIASIERLQTIITTEQLDNISAFVGDVHRFSDLAEIADETFDVVVCAVVLMFLDAERVPQVIRHMQSVTKAGGYNLIVCAMDSDDYPMSAHELPFDFGLTAGELSDYYQGWTLQKYNEDVGHLHRLDAEGNPIALRFATMLASKD